MICNCVQLRSCDSHVHHVPGLDKQPKPVQLARKAGRHLFMDYEC